jgi:hypothetical protein
MSLSAPEKATRRYRFVARLIGFIYLAGAAFFFFFPSQSFVLINIVPSLFGVLKAFPDSNVSFWLVQASTLMLISALLCFFSASSNGQKKYALILILSNIISVAEYLYLFLYRDKFFAYVLGITTNSLVAIILGWFLMVMAFKGRKQKDNSDDQLSGAKSNQSKPDNSLKNELDGVEPTLEEPELDGETEEGATHNARPD